MFGKLASKLTYNKVKVTASSSFINQIAQQKEDNQSYIEERKKIHELKYEDLLYSAIESLRVFVESNCNDEASFRETTIKLEEAQKLKPSHAEPYYYFSWLFLYIKEFELSAKYFNVANVINPDLDGLDDLRELIESFMKDKNQATNSYGQKEQSFKPQQLENSNVKTSNSEGEVFKPQPLQANMRKASNSYSQYNKF